MELNRKQFDILEALATSKDPLTQRKLEDTTGYSLGTINRVVKELSKEGLCGRDELRGGGVHDVEVRFHLPPGVERDEVSIDCPGELSWERCKFSEGFNLRREGWCAVFRQRLEFPCVIDWKVGSMPVVNKDQLPSRSVQS